MFFFLKGEHLKHPQFPPEAFKGFSFFKAEETKKGVVVKIQTKDDVKLSPYLALGRLWIKAE